MPSLFTRSDLRWLSDTVSAIYGAETAPELANRVATLTEVHFRSMVGGCEEIALDFSYYIPHDKRFSVRMPADFASFLHDHPAWDGLRSGAISQIFRIAECSYSSLEKTDFFNGFCRPIGLRDQLFAVARTETDIFVITSCRDGAFSASERELMLQIQPHLLAAWHRVRRLRASPGPLRLALLPDLRPVHTNIAMLQILRSYFPGRWPAGEALPAPLVDWVRASLAALRRPSPHRPLRAFQVDGVRGRLLARCFPKADSSVTHLVFVEIPADLNYLELIGHGLSPRECEVLHWLAQGKRNAEIATIINIAPRTADKHVETLRRKFGVTTRGSVVNAARERLIAAEFDTGSSRIAFHSSS